MVSATRSGPLHLKISNLPRAGREVSVTVDAAQRNVLANELGLQALDALDVHISAWPWGKGGVKLSGELHASVVQRCVVTFKPVTEDLAERFVRTYLPQRELDSLEHKLGLTETVEVAMEADEPPEPLEGDTIDLKAIILEELALAINPYPRHKDAETADLPQKTANIAEPGPFEILRKLTEGGDS